MRVKNMVMSAVLLASAGALAQSQSDSRAYCEYATEQATARRDLLLTPDAVSGVTRPETGLPTQLVWGLSGSLSNVRKAGLTMDAAHKDCELYSATKSAQQAIQYSLPGVEKQALEHRVELIQQASSRLGALIAGTSKLVEAQNLTRPMLFSLQTTKIRLAADLADTEGKIAALYTPDLAAEPLKQLVAKKQAGEVNEQNALARLNRQSNWDVSLSVGAHQQVNPLLDSPAPYGAITVSYNLSSPAIDKHLNQAAAAYAEWKAVQEGDVVRNADIVRKQAADSIVVQSNRLKSLQNELDQIQGNLQLVADTDTTAALDFRNQLTSAQLLLNIEIGDATFRLSLLRTFIEYNF
jgi:hypothetical protein